MEPEEPTLRCRFCGGDPFEPDHDRRCDGKQGKREAKYARIPRHRDTSAESFYEALASGTIAKRQSEIWYALQALGTATGSEVFEYLKRRQTEIAARNTHTRLTELRDMGVVKEVEKRRCTVTGRNCNAWAIVAESEYVGPAIVHRCPTCRQVMSRDIRL